MDHFARFPVAVRRCATSSATIFFYNENLVYKRVQAASNQNFNYMLRTYPGRESFVNISLAHLFVCWLVLVSSTNKGKRNVKL